MTATARLELAVFDAADIEKVGSFYPELTDWSWWRRGPAFRSGPTKTARLCGRGRDLRARDRRRGVGARQVARPALTETWMPSTSI